MAILYNRFFKDHHELFRFMTNLWNGITGCLLWNQISSSLRSLPILPFQNNLARPEDLPEILEHLRLAWSLQFPWFVFSGPSYHQVCGNQCQLQWKHAPGNQGSLSNSWRLEASLHLRSQQWWEKQSVLVSLGQDLVIILIFERFLVKEALICIL